MYLFNSFKIASASDSISDGLAVDHVNQLLFYTCTHYDVIMVASLSNPAIYRTIVNESLDEPRDIIVNSETGYVYTYNFIVVNAVCMYK